MSSLVQSILELPTIRLFEIFFFSLLLVLVISTIAMLGKTTQQHTEDIQRLYQIITKAPPPLPRKTPKKKE